MQADNNNSLVFIIKLLTPEEIERYCNEGTGKVVTKKLAAGAELLEWDLDEPKAVKRKPRNKGRPLHVSTNPEDDKAKILPFRSPTQVQLDDKVEAPDTLQAASPEPVDQPADANFKTIKVPITPNSAGSELESVGILSATQLKELEAEEIRQREANTESASVFLINQRKLLKASQAKLIEQQAIINYQKSSQTVHKADDTVIDPDAEILEGREKYQNSGVLFNKKQF